MKFKKFMACAVSLAVAAAVIPQTAFAATGDTGEYQGFSYEELEDGTLAVTGYSGNDAEITIPSDINGKKVTVIGYGAFNSCTSLKAVNLPDGLTTIDHAAFINCTSLTKINIPYSVVEIGDLAFSMCSSLTEITIPANVTKIGEGTDGVFGYCDSLTAITVDEGNKNYKDIDGVLYTKDGKAIVQFPCGKKGTYVIPDGVTSISGGAFQGCHFTEMTIPDGVTAIGDWAFDNCDSLTKINLPESITTIGDYSFSWCAELAELTIPDSVTAIGVRAFTACASLTEINVPASVATIGSGAFGSCNNLAAITVDENNKNYKDIDGVLFTKDGKTIVQFPAGKADTAYTVPDGVVTIAEDAFDSCAALTKVVLPDSVTAIMDSAFGYCSSLTEITIPASVIEINNYAFTRCSDDLTIYGYTGSTAETFAKENQIKFVALKDEGGATSNTTSPSTNTNPAESTTGTTAENGNTQNGASTDKNEPTGVVLALLPAAFAAAGVIISRKRK